MVTWTIFSFFDPSLGTEQRILWEAYSYSYNELGYELLKFIPPY